MRPGSDTKITSTAHSHHNNIINSSIIVRKVYPARTPLELVEVFQIVVSSRCFLLRLFAWLLVAKMKNHNIFYTYIIWRTSNKTNSLMLLKNKICKKNIWELRRENLFSSQSNVIYIFHFIWVSTHRQSYKSIELTTANQSFYFSSSSHKVTDEDALYLYKIYRLEILA